MLQDARFAVRMLLKDRWYTLVAVVALALGIGLNATVFTIVNAVLIRGLPFDRPEELLHVNGRHTVNGGNFGLSYLEYRDVRAQANTFAELGAYRFSSFTVTERGLPPERVQGTAVTTNLFRLLRQPPLLGRAFQPGEDEPGASPVVVLGHGIWQARYGGDPDILGRVITVNGVASTIVGVMPEGMKFPSNADMWRPLTPEADDLARRDRRNVNLVGRLASGATRDQASAEMTAIAARFEQAHPDTNRNVTAAVLTFNERFNGGPIRVIFLALLGAVGFVLLIACANVANLLLARSAGRAREVAVRLALGASRRDIVRQLLVESVLVATIGGVFGLGLAWMGVRLFDAAVADTGKPYWITFTFDPVVFAYLAAICLGTGILFGLAPAMQVSRTSMNEVLKEGGRGTAGGTRSRRMASAMVIAELTLTLVLLTGAGLMIRSFLKLYSIELGAETTRLLTMRMELPAQKYDTPEKRRIFYEQLMERLEAVPGIDNIALASALPFGGSGGSRFEVEGRAWDRPEDAPRTTTVVVSPSYFGTMGAAMRRGREFHDRDGGDDGPVAIVNERFASQFFPETDAVGQRIRLLEDGEQPQPGPWLTIVGVSPTIRQGDPQRTEPDAVVYQPYRLSSPGFMNILARSQVDPSAVIAPIREAVQVVDPDQPVFQIRTLDEFLAQMRWPYRVFGSMFAIFALIALVLSAVGIYAVTAYSVSQRTQEIGVRMALGAHPSQISWLILRRGLTQLLAGLALGLLLAWPLAQVLQSIVVQIPTRDPVTFGATIAVLSLVMFAACLIPARRATRLDPLAALRID